MLNAKVSLLAPLSLNGFFSKGQIFDNCAANHESLLAGPKNDSGFMYCFTATASVESKDRMGDIITVDGWVLKDFRTNSCLMGYHKYDQPLVGRSLEEWKEEKGGVKRLMFRPQFHSHSEEARFLYSLYKDKYLKGFSVGFQLLKWKDPKVKDEPQPILYNPNPKKYLKQSLLEISAVPIPAHSDALAVGEGVRKGSIT